MLSRIARATLLPASAAFAIAAPSAWASGIGNPVECSGASCTITVSAPGSGAGSSSSSGGGSGSGSGSSGGGGSTTSSPPPCTYALDTGYAPPAGTDSHPSGSGAWYLETCQLPIFSAGKSATTTTVVWLATPPAATTPSPAQLAAQAQSLLRLTTPVIGSSPKPGALDLVGLNLWAWVAASAWSAQSATASAGGLSVTATATPSYATWDFGDGTVITCQGPGTVYQPSDGANPLSPTCGHDYRQSGAFTENVTVHWTVTWAGAGQSGAFNDMTTTASAPITVEQSQTVVTR
jgi:hypothetical protein